MLELFIKVGTFCTLAPCMGNFCSDTKLTAEMETYKGSHPGGFSQDSFSFGHSNPRKFPKEVARILPFGSFVGFNFLGVLKHPMLVGCVFYFQRFEVTPFYLLKHESLQR